MSTLQAQLSMPSSFSSSSFCSFVFFYLLQKLLWIFTDLKTSVECFPDIVDAHHALYFSAIVAVHYKLLLPINGSTFHGEVSFCSFRQEEEQHRYNFCWSPLWRHLWLRQQWKRPFFLQKKLFSLSPLSCLVIARDLEWKGNKIFTNKFWFN